MNNNEAIKEIRTIARKVGLTFKIDKSITINGATAYKFINRETGYTVLSDCTLNSAYSNVQSGYIETWNGDVFKGLGQYKSS